MFKVNIFSDLVTNLTLLVSVLSTIGVMLKSDQLTWPVPHKLYECSRKQRTLLWVAHSIMVSNIGITWHNEASGRNTILHQSQRTSIRTLGLIEENSRFKQFGLKLFEVGAVYSDSMPSDVKPHSNSNNFRARWELTHSAALARYSIKYRVFQFPCTESSEQVHINLDGCPLQNPYFATIPWPFQFLESTTNNPRTNHYPSYLRQVDIFVWFQRCVSVFSKPMPILHRRDSPWNPTSSPSPSAAYWKVPHGVQVQVWGGQQRSSVGSWRYTNMLHASEI